ncbi:MAG: WYL domain-containing protein [Lachnospiraceae bacterium]|nr:WYL domain-containing protein [Lachnospiraceae bacterium]
MSKSSNQKLKLYYLARILAEETDADHALTMNEIIEMLGTYGISADRKSIYDDVEALRVLGFEVVGQRDGKSYTYSAGAKVFELAELKLLVDAITSSKFITEKKSGELIRKLTGFASKYEASQLNRQVVVQGRVKARSETIYYNVDEIHAAISENRQLSFEYLKWDADKQLVPRRDRPYVVSPWALTWSEDNYYLIAYDPLSGGMRHYRVDKMRKTKRLPGRREGREIFREQSLAKYTNERFGMLGGTEKKVTIRCREDLIGIFLDRFGKEIPVTRVKGAAGEGGTEGENWLEIRVDVAVSGQFFGWIFGIGDGVRITGPEDVVETYAKRLREMAEIYR